MKNAWPTVGAVLLGTMLVFAIPQTSQASLIFSPFGGKVVAYIPGVGCASLTRTIAAMTWGTVMVTVDKLIILDSSNQQQRTLGFLNITLPFLPIPILPIMTLLGLTNLYSYYNYVTPQVWVLGNAWSVNGLCDAGLGATIGKAVCKTITTTLEQSCSITEVVHQIGTGLTPDTGKNSLSNSK